MCSLSMQFSLLQSRFRPSSSFLANHEPKLSTASSVSLPLKMMKTKAWKSSGSGNLMVLSVKAYGSSSDSSAESSGTRPKSRRDILLEYVQNVKPEFMEMFVKRAPKHVSYERKNDLRRPQDCGGKDKIDALGRLLTRILRHMATELRLNMLGDGFVEVEELLKLNFKTSANIKLKSHTIDEIREAVRRDNKHRFSLLEENGELLIRANQGHSITTVESEKLLKPILSPEEAPVCTHGTYRKNLESILASGLKRMNRMHVHLPTDGEVISGMRRNVNVLIFLDIKKALEDGIAFYISDNKVILTEGIDGVVHVDYFQKIES